MRINVGVGVLGLAVLRQDARGNLVDLADELEHRVIWQLAKSELPLRDISRISLSKDRMTIAGDDTAGVQGRPQIICD